MKERERMEGRDRGRGQRKSESKEGRKGGRGEEGREK